uniref:PhzF family phenazine biosynthesis protein n=1 Tax=unclassified Rhodococcus (in: high G+C Gram-positive bacteria) TaxID=192944 RepID=UPI0015956D89|nr:MULTISPECIES: PhzF family phenazine biosynthesis protein [unclassified Rhodococcus (in: high G+C Gram-positive bacteria)]
MNIVNHYDAFADRSGEGNPAAIVEHDHPVGRDVAAAISREIGAPMTALIDHQLPNEPPPAPDYPALSMRWYDFTGTPAHLCGHATLAAATHYLGVYGTPTVQFHTPTGWIRADRWHRGARFDLPATRPTPTSVDPVVRSLLPSDTGNVLTGRDDALIAVVPPSRLADLALDLEALAATGLTAIGFTSTAENFDYQCRWFNLTPSPAEDPVTGSAHIQIAPYWAAEKPRPVQLRGRQISRRPVTVHCTVNHEKTVTIAGNCTHSYDVK